MSRHLAIFDREAIGSIFSGKKKVEGRFSQIKISPFSKVARGDVVLMKLSGEEIVGQFLVDRVVSFDHPNKEDVEFVKRKYGKDLSLPGTFWLEKEKINYITLMIIGTVTKFIVPPVIKKKDLRPWVVLDNQSEE